MKNLISLTSEREIFDFVGRLWKSEPFKKSMNEMGFIFDQVERFAWLPRMFAQSTNDYLERAHFSTWWNVILMRDYDNPIIHDLYYLHEMAHAATMPYIPGIGRAAFDEKMQRNELEASVLSEIAIYFEIPELREKSFQHEIYADRFLNDPEITALWRANPTVALETIRFMRRNVMLSKPEHLMDRTERWIRRFAEQNTTYAIVWGDRYDEIESRMRKLQIESAQDRTKALRNYRNWLIDETNRSKDLIPFRQESELFSPFYWANKRRYDGEYNS